MKKIKKFYKEHRIFTILMSIVIVCIILIITIAVQLFYFGNGNDKYGARCEGADQVEISDSRKSDFEANMTTDGKVKIAEIKVQCKSIYIYFQFDESVNLDDAKGIALKSLESFTDEEKDFYDFQFTLKKNSNDTIEGFLIEGAKNKNGNGLIWNNNRKVEPKEADSNATEKDE